MSRFNFTLKYVLETKMEKVDRLRRRPDWKVGIENNNNNHTLIKYYWIHSLSKVVIEGSEVDIVEKIKNARSKDEEVVRIVEEMKKTEIKVLWEDKWQIEGDLVLKKKKVYVPKDKELWIEIIQLHHDVLVVGYRGRWKTTELVTRNYWWPGVMRDMERYMEGYDMCQRMKNRMGEVAEKLKLSEVLEKSWIYLTIDFITKLLLVAGKNTILVVCDRLSKITYFVATTEGTLAEGLARLFRDNIWKLYRLPESVVLDRRPQFAAKLTKELNRMLGIKTKLLTAFHPQTDGQTE